MQTKISHSTRKAVGLVRSSRAQTHEVRIIGGHWKRIKLKVADRPGLRPTPDRVRETLFNWLGQNLSGLVCVDAFAGTGALGFEAASRGAREVLLVEQDAALATQLHKVQAQLQALVLPEPVEQTLRIQRGEGVAALRQLANASQNVIFLDPPFEGNLHEAALGAASRALAPQGAVYLEAPKCWTNAELAPFGLQVARHLKAGAVHAHVLHALPTPELPPETAVPSESGGVA
jgi:16S rRNA (guanine966-N2)-methyltransferase